MRYFARLHSRQEVREIWILSLLAIVAAGVGCARSVPAHDARGPTTAPTVIGEYYIGGHVKRPGAYSLTDRGMTLRQALSAAGAMKLDGASRVYLVRDSRGRSRTTVWDIRAAALEAGRGDLVVQADDQIMCGTSAMTNCVPPPPTVRRIE